MQFAQAFPGWTGYVAGQTQTTTIPNGIPIGAPGLTPPFIAILVSDPFQTVYQGNYGVAFGAGIDMGSGSLVTVALAQIAQVPAQAKSLQFLAANALTVFLGGQPVSSVPLGTGPSLSTLFGVDVSGFAGQTLELRFRPGLGINYLDAIQFSAQAIPEPGVFGLFGFGALFLGWRLRGTLEQWDSKSHF
ncbi:MAG: PEP-CTERM sorting domain-containing protein [Verrucomicrobia bacterium]|nr:PEP-CTERM sorting domain-containing protein [Verrucomicrobiota bacterium]